MAGVPKMVLAWALVALVALTVVAAVSGSPSNPMAGNASAMSSKSPPTGELHIDNVLPTADIRAEAAAEDEEQAMLEADSEEDDDSSSKSSTSEEDDDSKAAGSDFLASLQAAPAKVPSPKLSTAYLTGVQKQLDAVRDQQAAATPEQKKTLGYRARQLAAKRLADAVKRNAALLIKVESKSLTETEFVKIDANSKLVSKARGDIRKRIADGSITIDPKTGTVVDKTADARAKKNAAIIAAAIDAGISSKRALKKLKQNAESKGQKKVVAKPFSYSEHAANPKAAGNSAAPTANLTSAQALEAKKAANKATAAKKSKKSKKSSKKPSSRRALREARRALRRAARKAKKAKLACQKQYGKDSDKCKEEKTEEKKTEKKDEKKSLAQSARFQQLPPGVDGDGHHERIMSTVQEIMDANIHSKDYKGHVNARGQLCPGCEPIVYNHDSPMSDDDIKIMRAQHADLVLGHVKLLGQADLDRATLALDDADAAKKAILDRYPAKPEGGAAGYEEGGEAGKKFDSLLQFDLHN